MVKIIVVNGDPLPAERPRFGKNGAYQGARTREWRREIEMAARLTMKADSPMKGALKARVKLYRRFQPTSKRFGDVDNHLKAIFDGLNGIVLADDSQIVRCLVEKFCDKKNPRVEIEICAAQT